MNTILLLFILGLVFLFFEVFTPGPIFGILGGLTLIGGIAMAFGSYGANIGLLAAVGAIMAVSATLYAELVWLPKTRFAQKLSIKSTSGSIDRQLPVPPGEVVGKTAEALTTLAPSGYVLVEGRRYEAFSQSGHVARGEQLLVAGLDNLRLIVTKK
ncbi:MAG TPA: NfeD family protein [Opitutaceae bacterium]|jgi:membrane-bound serine protease (ClpP class)|nr:NfeD family protein [Opitutaceae bacterium]